MVLRALSKDESVCTTKCAGKTITEIIHGFRSKYSLHDLGVMRGEAGDIKMRLCAQGMCIRMQRDEMTV